MGAPLAPRPWYSPGVRTLIHGPDAALCDEQVARALAEARAADAGVEVAHYDGEAVSAHDLAMALSSLSLFATARLVIVSGLAERVQKDAALREALAAALAAAPPGLGVVFREGRELGATHPLAAAVRAAGGRVVACAPLSTRDFQGKLQQAAAELGIGIAPDALALLAERSHSEFERDGRKRDGPDLTRGRTELVKLAAFAGAGRTIERGMVEALVAAPQQQVFAFTGALANRQLARAERVLDELLERGQPAQVIFAMLVRQFRLLLLYVAGQRERGQTAFLRGGEFHLRDFQLRDLGQQAAAFTPERLREVFGLLLRADEAIKTGRLDAEQALRLLTASVGSGADLLPDLSS